MLFHGFSLGLPAPVLRDSDVADDVLRVPLKPGANLEALKARMEALKAEQLRQFSAGYACLLSCVAEHPPVLAHNPTGVTGLH